MSGVPTNLKWNVQFGTSYAVPPEIADDPRFIVRDGEYAAMQGGGA